MRLLPRCARINYPSRANNYFGWFCHLLCAAAKEKGRQTERKKETFPWGLWITRLAITLAVSVSSGPRKLLLRLIALAPRSWISANGQRHRSPTLICSHWRLNRGAVYLSSTINKEGSRFILLLDLPLLCARTLHRTRWRVVLPFGTMQLGGERISRAHLRRENRIYSVCWEAKKSETGYYVN